MPRARAFFIAPSNRFYASGPSTYSGVDFMAL
jgi:hypothetical protein